MFGILGCFRALMGKRQKQVVSRPSSSRGENSKELPIDLLIDIFSRLPLEDVARCRCVSKLWSSILLRREFTQLFLKMSSTQPRLLFTFVHNRRRIFYSIPQDLDPDRDYSYPISPYYHMHSPKGVGSCPAICPPLLGFVCSKAKKPMICNPSTGQNVSLPKAITKKVYVNASFGYDHINKLFKVLCMSNDYVCRVSTIGMGEVTPRTVECSIPHQPLHTEICIDGVLYYLGNCKGGGTPTPTMVVCFDVRLERFKFIAIELQIVGSALINYKGKLGILLPNSSGIHEYTESFELWILEDAEEVKWSKTIFILPYYWKYLAADTYLYIVGMTSAGVIVLSTLFLQDPFYVFFYNVEKNTVTRVAIEFGIVAKKAQRSTILAFTNHVENVELMD